jgi:transposase
MAIVDSHGLPVSVCIESASPHEVTLVEKTLQHLFVKAKPQRLIGDKAYDSDGLDKNLRDNKNIEMIAPHRMVRNRKNEPTQDGRPLRRYRRRWKVERFFAWLNNFRRLTIRWEFHAANFLGFLRLACTLILLRSFSG